MKILFTFLLAGLLGFCAPKSYSQTSGLNYVTYAGTGATPNYTNLAYPNPLSLGIVSNINYNWGSGYVLTSGRVDQVIIHFTGYINIPTAGTYTFGGNADDGLVISINNTTIINSWQEDGGSFRQGSINLPAGAVPISVWYYENGGGALVNFQWYQNNSWQVVPSTSLYTSMPAPQYTSSITGGQSAQVSSVVTRMSGVTTASSNSIYINQTGNGDVINITQVGYANKIDGANYNSSTGVAGYQQSAPITGGSNNITIRQGDPMAKTGNNLIDLAAIGGNNTLNLNQGTDVNGNYTGLDQGGHYQFDYINGSYNNITVVQENTGVSGNQFSSLVVIGNLNTVGITQTGNAQKQLFASVTGNSNTVTTSQTGTSKDYLSITTTGNGNSAVVTQNNSSASGANAATIVLNNAGAPASVNVTQTGGQTYNITQTCVTTCGTVTVRQ